MVLWDPYLYLRKPKEFVALSRENCSAYSASRDVAALLLLMINYIATATVRAYPVVIAATIVLSYQDSLA